ncbi:MAG: hypothetical protein AAB019_11765 [Planctomycetota bacterium]
MKSENRHKKLNRLLLRNEALLRRVAFDGARKQIEIYRRMSGAERLQIGCELYDLAKQIISASIRKMFPNLSEEEFRNKLKERMNRGTG